jgi:hypothetical protein
MKNEEVLKTRLSETAKFAKWAKKRATWIYPDGSPQETL